MQVVNTFGIDIFARLLPKDRSTARIYARITVNGQSKELSLKHLVCPNDWDSKKEKILGKGIEVKAANEHIDDVRFRLKEHYRALENKQLTITAQDVKDAYLGIHVSQNDNYTFSRLMAYHAEQMKGKLKPGTLKNYTATEKYVKAFIKRKFRRDDIYLLQLDYAFITELETYIPNNPIKGYDVCTANGTAKHIERIKKMVKWAKKLHWLKTNPFEDFSPHRVRVKKPKLKMSEVMQLEGASLLDEKLNFIKDLFVFSCYTGMAYGDLMAVRPEDFHLDDKGKMWCLYYRVKSDEAAGIPMLAKGIEIMGKYKDSAESLKRGTIFPYVSNQEVNRCLKIIQELFHIPIKMTFHLARHTFASTMMLKSGIPLVTVSKMLGHSKISTTEVYTEVDEEKIELDMVGIEEKLRDRKQLVIAI